MRLVRVTHQRQFTDDEWHTEAVFHCEDENVIESFKNLTAITDPKDGTDTTIRIDPKYYTLEEDPLYCYQYYWFENLPDPEPEYLMDWYLTNTREILTRIAADATSKAVTRPGIRECDGFDYNQYAYWGTVYKREKNLTISDITVIDSSKVSTWMG